MRHPAEDEQSDLLYFLAQPVSHQRVCEFVNQYRGEEQNGGYESDQPIADSRISGIGIWKVSRRQAPEHDRKQDDPRVVERYLNPTDLEDVDFVPGLVPLHGSTEDAPVSADGYVSGLRNPLEPG
jgi:hypothetical protein